MSDLQENPNPVVINEKLILAAVSVKDSVGSDGKESRKVDTEIDPRYKQHVVMHNDVKDLISLNLSFSNIAKIQNLVGLTALRKLKLNSNLITQIEGLNNLPSLEWLNLSFNNIRKIENLGDLKQLTDLSLAHNQIDKLENLDANMQLNVLCMAHNSLNKTQSCKEIILYLCKLPKVQAISLKQNGYDEEEAYKWISYILRKIRFVDQKAMNFDEEKIAGNVPQQVKGIRDQIEGEDNSDSQNAEEMSPDLKDMYEHFNNFISDLNKKDEVKTHRNDVYEEQLFQNFDSMMQKQQEKWVQKVSGEIKNLYSKAETLRNVVLIRLEEAQTRVELQNSDLVNTLKFKMKSLPNSKTAQLSNTEIEQCQGFFMEEVSRIEKELIENEVALYNQIVPPDENQSDSDQYFSKQSYQCEQITEQLNKFCDDFKANLQEILENIFNKENIQRSGGSSEKKSEEDRRGENQQKIKELAITEFQQKTVEKTSKFDGKFNSFKTEKSEQQKERYKKNINYIKTVCNDIRTKVNDRRAM